MLILITTRSGFTVADFSQPTQDNSIVEQGNVVTVDVVGESRCPDTTRCTCQHGPEECRKNALQACVIDVLPSAVDYLDIVACIQGPSGFSEAFTKCIANPTVSGKLDQNRMFQCANSDEGRLLMAEHGSGSLQFGADIYWVPWIAINGLRIPAAEQHFEDVLCNQYFVPQPPECQTAQA
ncbi:gamma interferon inducible lysosomal thiol reductase [Necator americanus]|uniref:Gamma interferon inducible lysosomal thiol reductase n=1 Tax=Necator americanus TaxID=51031 RepID=W2T022_NECAM|nr:gamma interferon inducible lysosomal thiol reductase [Necator americanus]ETN75345.1 gamma interferon inducible lysosomal thiol reductase [Necator americanus]